MEAIQSLRLYKSGDMATLKSSQGAVSIFRSQDALFAEQFTDSVIGVKLLSTDNYKSVTHAKSANQQALFAYAPYGYYRTFALSSRVSGFNGEYPDPATENYMLGNGYRAFSPSLSRFICADSASPLAKAVLMHMLIA